MYELNGLRSLNILCSVKTKLLKTGDGDLKFYLANIYATALSYIYVATQDWYIQFKHSSHRKVSIVISMDHDGVCALVDFCLIFSTSVQTSKEFTIKC